MNQLATPQTVFSEPQLSRRNAEQYLDLTAYKALKKAERERYGWRPLVFICSPYAADTKEQLEANIQIARQLSALAVRRGKIPIAPHLLFPQFMDDAKPDERDLGLFMARIILTHCPVMWIWKPQVTQGMELELAIAKTRGMIIKYFNADFQEVGKWNR